MRSSKKQQVIRREEALEEFQERLKLGAFAKQLVWIPRAPEDFAVRLRKPIAAYIELVPPYGWLTTSPICSAGAVMAQQQDSVYRYLLALAERLWFLQSNRARLAPPIYDEYLRLSEYVAWKHGA